jgi:glycosyltransferase involved in cell wall biosynthesis
MKILLLGGHGPWITTFRGYLIDDFVRDGHEVFCCAPGIDEEVGRELLARGATPVGIDMQRNQIGIVSDFCYFVNVYRVCRALRPTLVLAYAAKPVIYGTMAAALARVPNRFALITGLGYAFTGAKHDRRGIRFAVTTLYRIALKYAQGVIFQNADDRDQFVHERITRRSKTCVVPGSGIDPAGFPMVAPHVSPFTFALIARLLSDKGIREYVAAAAVLKCAHPQVRFLLIGPQDPSPAAIPEKEIATWRPTLNVEYVGGVADVRPWLAQTSVFVLPSYREGMPKTVLEAMACGRPIITTDVPGCRETVQPGVNGLLVKAKSVEDLVAAMRFFIDDPRALETMGRESRRIACEKFDVRVVNSQMIAFMRERSSRASSAQP